MACRTSGPKSESDRIRNRYIFQEKEDMDHSEKLKLYGFNNLTKALSFNIYDVCYAKTAEGAEGLYCLYRSSSTIRNV